MKKTAAVALAAVALTMASCSTITHTAQTEAVNTELHNRSNADLKVSGQRISYTFTPNDTYRRAGEKALRNAAVAKALEANGNADVLVAPQFEVKKTRGLFATKVKYIKVSGYPASYGNVHSTTLPEAEVVNILDGGVIVRNCSK